MYTSKERVCLNADRSSVVDCESEAAAWQLVEVGGTITDEQARKYGLLKKAPEKAVEAESEGGAKEVSAPPENKAVHAAQAQNKKANGK